ncbi:MAG: glycoside hydrolase family 113, partial [Polyangia bacterium]
MMLVRLSALALLVAASAAATAAPVRGVALGLFAEDAGWSYRPLLDEIAAAGADQVELVVPWYQTDASSTAIVDHPRYTPPPAAIVAAIRDARAAGLGVTLFPIVRLSAPRTPDEWRGTLAPADRAAWWRSYRARLVELARLAAREQVAVLSIGSELSTLDGTADRAAWAATVAELRRVFHGALLYSGNWDHFRDVAVYDLVDLVGLCGYFALVEPGAPATVEDLTRGWRDWRVE